MTKLRDDHPNQKKCRCRIRRSLNVKAQGTEPPLSRASDKNVTGVDFNNTQKGSSSETVDLTVDTGAPSTLTTSD